MSTTRPAGVIATPPYPRLLPWIIGGALYGLALRLIFGVLADRFVGPMSMAFLIGTPMAVGAITVLGMRNGPSPWRAVIFYPWATVILMLAGCALAMLEGAICLAIMSPLFLVFASLGGTAMKIAMPHFLRNEATLKAIAIFPFLLVGADFGRELPASEVKITQRVLISASPATVWDQIVNARDIKPTELPPSLTHAIGVPRPLEGVNVTTPRGEMRFSKWERGVNFRSLVTDKQTARAITFQFEFDENSFPKGSMDDHVAIGGRYFQLRNARFNLEPVPGGKTELELLVNYRVSSSINFYAVPVARVLANDFVATILGLYKVRSEQADPSPPQEQ